MRHKMSGMRQTRRPDPAGPAARGYAVTHPSGTVVLPTEPGWDQLVYASAGVMTVETDSGNWVIPPHRALWAPDGTRYRILMHGRVSVRTLYLRSSLGAVPDELRAVNVSPLLRELVLHAVRTAPLHVDVAEDRRLIGVLLDQLATLSQAPLQLPLPRDPRSRALAARLMGDPRSTVRIEALARDVGASRRTLERLFLVETGMTIGRWRQRLRLLDALRRLAEGEPVTAVAHAVGYSTPSAFGAMFRQELGDTPGRYFRA
jgi:AraC-like DNA-binding protein